MESVTLSLMNLAKFLEILRNINNYQCRLEDKIKEGKIYRMSILIFCKDLEVSRVKYKRIPLLMKNMLSIFEIKIILKVETSIYHYLRLKETETIKNKSILLLLTIKIKHIQFEKIIVL